MFMRCVAASTIVPLSKSSLRVLAASLAECAANRDGRAVSALRPGVCGCRTRTFQAPIRMLHGAFPVRFGGTGWIGHVAEWLRSGLQIRAPRFDSGRGLQTLPQRISKRFSAFYGTVRSCCIV